jgi:sugar O-acyltransferase (sialic acid O-acetyltransferase NeuD family)
MVVSPVSESVPPLLIFGASGHGRVVADAAMRSGHWEGLFVSDRNPARIQSEFLPGVITLAPSAISPEMSVHVAIGDNKARQLESQALGVHRMATVQHPDATVSPLAKIAPGCLLTAQSVVAPGAQVGLAVIVNHGAVIDHDSVVGDYTHIAPRACLGGGVRVGMRVLLGAGAVVLPGLKICDDVIVGAGAVICESIEEVGTYVGVPARRLG